VSGLVGYGTEKKTGISAKSCVGFALDLYRVAAKPHDKLIVPIASDSVIAPSCVPPIKIPPILLRSQFDRCPRPEACALADPAAAPSNLSPLPVVWTDRRRGQAETAL
jgi:hypothetical protein